MPELPEVEVTLRGFRDRVDGATIEAVRLGKPLRWPLGCSPDSLVGRVAGSASRRGKYLWLPLSGGGLLLHLGMSGSLLFSESASPPGPHDHLDVTTSRGILRLHDPRRFGAAVWSESLQHGRVAALLSSLGVEPFTLAWTPEHLHAGLKGRRVSVKQALLAGDIVVGVGNIYASEALFRAGVHPATPSHRVGPARCRRLVISVTDVLGEAIAAGGSSLRDFRDVLGQPGHFQTATRVYDRAGKPCYTCATPIERLVQGQRSSFFCRRCQRR